MGYVKSLVLSLIIVVICLAQVRNIAHADSYEDRFKPGTTFSGNIEFNSTSPVIPMPPGTWEVAYFQTWMGSQQHTNVLNAKGLFVQRKDGNLYRVVYLAAPLSYNMNGYSSSKTCDRINMHFMNKVANTPGGDQDCHYVNHNTPAQAGNKSKFANAVGKYFLDNKIPWANHMIYSGHHLASSNLVLAVRYYFNPQAEGFENYDRTTWKVSPWHPSTVASDEKKMKYVQKIINWSKNWHAVVHRGFKRELKGGEIIGVVEKPAPQDLDTQSQSKKMSLTEAKTVCSGLGFTVGTENYGNCVLKLID